MGANDVDRILSGTVLAELRQMNDGNLPHVATVTVRPSSGPRVGGALVTNTPTTLYTDVPCRLTPRRRPAEDVLGAGDQLRAVKTWTLSFTAGTTIPEGALAIVSGRGAGGVWQRAVRVGAPAGSLSFPVSARYTAQDVPAGGR
jgi:hypothetical protein